MAERTSAEAKAQRTKTFVAVVGHGPLLEREDGAAATLRQLGANVRTLDLWDDPVNLIEDDDDENNVRPRALVFEERRPLTV